MTDQTDVQFGSPDCTCIPWTRQTDPPRYLDRPTDTVDMISGWERRQDCPHHAPAEAQTEGCDCGHPLDAHAGLKLNDRCSKCGCSAYDRTTAPDDTDLTEADIDRMMSDGTPVQIVNGPPPTFAVTVDPADDTPASAPELRDQIAEALMAWAERNNAPQYAAIRRPDTVRQNAYSRADAVLAVPAIQQLQTQVNGWRHKAIQRAIRLGRHETTLAELRVFAAEEVTARNGWGDGYRDALRDLTELLDTLAPSDEPAALDPQEQP